MSIDVGTSCFLYRKEECCKMILDDIKPIEFGLSGNNHPMIIAGPCSAETEEQVITTARDLSKIGIKVYRAGIWKPRTKPGCFEGVGEIGLSWLEEVKRETGMRIATEVATSSHVESALKAGVDVLWIGARTSANPFLMQEIADSLSGVAEITVLIKNPVNPDLELWIGAIQRIYNAGIRRIGAIHRGFSSYGTHIYRNMPQWYIPIELRRRIPHLPIFCDPSHIGGKRSLIAPLSQQALDMGFDGLIIESHCCPECALSDSEQQVTPSELKNILDSLVVRNVDGFTEELTLLRQQIDQIDAEILEVLNRRMSVSKKIGEYKRLHKMSVLQADRYDNLLKVVEKNARQLGLGEDFIKTIYQAIHEESVRQQIAVVNGKKDR